MITTHTPLRETDLPALHRRALSSTRRFLVAVEANQWSNMTPCDDWDVRSVANHIVAGNLWAAELASGRTIDDVGDRLNGNQLGDNPIEAFDRSAEMAAHAFETPGVLRAPCAVSYGPVPGSVYLGHRFLDVLIHGWDIAVATGQEPALDPSLVEACQTVIEPQIEQLQASGMFGSVRGTGQSTDPQARLLQALGRTVPQPMPVL
ncbi:MAG: TIGR03086 family protein [Acidimicrobiales bacterium]|nr:TIGR03086 family protein [Acidimicrobiales bacterium]